ncbi:UDP-Glycosyltransferase/glycogen phosphorylase [Aspergillus fijiensis CBS 313.89]|uniref:UDP-Glycosyltransferase/glycogen phosphorylase n=1 Tax=Aspergillus fijiensis CBS 313.89 TaxID=1448319 RepID=A0A8G1W168_9EURO|nr:UDP-Glycosyltransferase/glycogen phosphorylase [Aspergillus fijiensis CBS 313.89]RAK79081.1 UDP-Glycosyltransferase/glycogen phosphorylase [Aspergillus fijiensis CBS 313.89]
MKKSRTSRKQAPVLRRRSTRKKTPSPPQSPLPTQRPRVLFLANSEHGQTNLILALSHELLVRGDTDVHIASFPTLKPRIEKLLVDNNLDSDGVRSRIHFHPLNGPSNSEAFARTGKRTICHPPGYQGALKGFKSLFEEIWAWNEEEYLQVYDSCLETVLAIEPSVVLVDCFFPQGRDAAYNAGHQAIVLYTTSLSHVVYGLQPFAGWAWKFPLPGTDFPYPLPWSLVPSNTRAAMDVAKLYRRSGRQRQIREWRKRHGIQGRFPFADSWRPDRFHLAPGLKELDWPMEVPENVLPCGPILLPVAPVKTQDPELHRWLHRAPTILINLGTLYAPDPVMARNIASGVRSFLDSRTDKFQVLWKLPKHTQDCAHVFEEAEEILAAEIKDDRVRIQPWFQVEPLAMLQTGQIVCSVHHGGANSWYEAIQSGIPHVVLPGWQDCYENAVRTEWLGIGVYANKTAAPAVDADEFGRALIRVVGNVTMQAKAKELSALCCKREGRVVGAEKIAELAYHPERMALPIPEVNQYPKDKLRTIRNKFGGILETVNRPHLDKYATSKLYTAASTLFVALTTNTSLLLPILGYALLILVLIPSLPIPLLIRTLYPVYVLMITYFPPTSLPSFPSPSSAVRNSPLWSLYANYFPLKLYRITPLAPYQKYIFGYHPHGISIRGAIGALATQGAGFDTLFPGLNHTLLVSDKVLRAPLLREYALCLGIGSVSRASCIKLLSSGGHDGNGLGQAITICVGGDREARIARPGRMDLVLGVRRGFIRVAIEMGASLVPVVAFGENEVFDVAYPEENDANSSEAASSHWEGEGQKQQDGDRGGLFTAGAKAWKAITGKSTRVISGRWGVTVPFRKPIHVVVGKPIPVKEQRYVQDEAYVEEVHRMYVEELRRLWEEWRDVFGVKKEVRFEIVQ